MSLPLNGIRVLDISRGVAASFCTLVLADYGAEVIKIEAPMGDTVRYIPPLFGGMGTNFIALNRNKKSIQLDLNDETDREQFLRLAENADVVIENFRPAILDRMKLNYSYLNKVNSKIILCSVSSFGQKSEWKDKPCHDISLMGLSGMLNGMASGDGQPILPLTFLAATAGGSLWAVIGILLALQERQSTGKGRHVDVAMFHGLQSLMIPELIAEIATGETQSPGNTWNTGLYPVYNNYKTKDGKWITFAAMEPKYWKNFCDYFNRPDLLNYGFPVLEKTDYLKNEIQNIFGSYTRDELAEICKNTEIIAEPVLTMQEALNTPPAKEHGTLFHINARSANYPQIKLPLEFEDESPKQAPPLQNEHAKEYLD